MDFGIITDYATGQAIRPASPAEWRRTSDMITAGTVPGAYTGAFEDWDGRTVYVEGGPEAEVGEGDLRDLAAEAAGFGDEAAVKLCDEALGGDDRAFFECARVILDSRMRAAAGD